MKIKKELSNMFEVWEVGEYLGSRELQGIFNSEKEAQEYVAKESKYPGGVTYASGSYIWYLEIVSTLAASIK